MKIAFYRIFWSMAILFSLLLIFASGARAENQPETGHALMWRQDSCMAESTYYSEWFDWSSIQEKNFVLNLMDTSVAGRASDSVGVREWRIQGGMCLSRSQKIHYDSYDSSTGDTSNVFMLWDTLLADSSDFDDLGADTTYTCGYDHRDYDTETNLFSHSKIDYDFVPASSPYFRWKLIMSKKNHGNGIRVECFVGAISATKVKTRN